MPNKNTIQMILMVALFGACAGFLAGYIVGINEPRAPTFGEKVLRNNAEIQATKKECSK